MSEPTGTGAKPPPSVAKVATLATLGVLLAGALIGGGILWSLHRYGSASSCPAPSTTSAPQHLAASGPELDGNGWVNVGDVGDIRDRAELSPYYGTLGGRCEYWITLDHGTLYAYKSRIPGSSCAVIWNQPRHTFICNQTKQAIALSQLGRWPARVITSGPNKNSFEIDFG